MFSDQKFILDSADDKLQALLSENGAKVFQKEETDLENVFYVINNFDDLNFEDVVKKGARVISHEYVLESIEKQVPVPLKDHPLYSTCLEGKTVVLDVTLTMEMKERFDKLVRYMSGTCSDSVVEGTSVLVGSSVGSLEYKVALENDVVVVEPKWIEECWKQKKWVDPVLYKMKAFSGCLIAVTGLASPTRLEIKRLVEMYGGEYTPDLTRSCTHLLSKEPEGLKYHYAIQWGIHCVSPEWFFDSINELCCKDERLYLLPIVSRRPLFSPRSRNELGRMSPKLRNNHVSQLKSSSRFGKRSRGPMNVVFINSDKKKMTNSQLLQNHLSSLTKSTNRLVRRPTITPTNTSQITKEEVTKLIELCDETINYYTTLANQSDISENLSELHFKSDAQN